MTDWTDNDVRFMQRALELARKGQGLVEPNPMVGCVIVKAHRVVGEGYHRRFGSAHAERNALRASKENARGTAGRTLRGATAYVTLEPCSHTGKTPPCTEALIEARVERVVAAMRDPNPLVAGRGLRKLRKAGIQVDVGLLRDNAMTLNAPFVKFHRKQRPHVILKWAQSIDGKIATRTGDSKWITSRQSRKAAHALRARVDAVVVGVGTVIADNPRLTARLAKPKRIAARVVLDPRLRIPLDAELVQSAGEIPTLIATRKLSRRQTHDSKPITKRRRVLEQAGCEVLPLRSTKSGILLGDLLDELHRRQHTNILVEGGGVTIGAFLQQNLADEARVFVAPSFIGGTEAPGPLQNIGPALVARRTRLSMTCITHHGPDLCYNVRIGGSG